MGKIRKHYESKWGIGDGNTVSNQYLQKMGVGRFEGNRREIALVGRKINLNMAFCWTELANLIGQQQRKN